jgi:hypothetical protein
MKTAIYPKNLIRIEDIPQFQSLFASFLAPPDELTPGLKESTMPLGSKSSPPSAKCTPRSSKSRAPSSKNLIEFLMEDREDLVDDFRTTLDEVAEALSSALDEFAMRGSSDILVNSLKTTMSHLRKSKLNLSYS